MGSCCSTISLYEPVEHGELGTDVFSKRIYTGIFLSENDVEHFRRVFRMIDVDGSGEIGTDEFFGYLRIGHTPLNTRMFLLFDTDGSGSLNFLEFVCSLWNYLSMDKLNLPAYAFFMFDSDKTDNLDSSEVRDLMETIHQDRYEKSEIVRKHVDALQSFSSNLSLKSFKAFCAKRPTAYAPLLTLQQNLREILFGTFFWDKMEDTRVKHPEQLRAQYIGDLYESITRKRERYEARKAKKEQSDNSTTNRERRRSSAGSVQNLTREQLVEKQREERKALEKSTKRSNQIASEPEENDTSQSIPARKKSTKAESDKGHTKMSSKKKSQVGVTTDVPGNSRRNPLKSVGSSRAKSRKSIKQ